MYNRHKHMLKKLKEIINHDNYYLLSICIEAIILGNNKHNKREKKQAI